MNKSQSKISIRCSQDLLRSEHERLIMDLLFAGPKSCSDISKLLPLSNTAAKICIDELSLAGLVKKSLDSSPSSHYGRHPINFEADPSIGVLCVIALDIEESQIVLHDIMGRIFLKKVIPCGGKINRDILKTIKDDAYSMLNSLKPRLPLLNITISTPGKIDFSGHYFYARNIDDYATINLQDIFSSFKAPVNVYRDTNLGCLGERIKGSFTSEDKNVYYAYIDYEAGGSLYLDGSFYHGSHGFAGETSSFNKVDSLSSLSLKGTFATLKGIEDKVGEGHIGLKGLQERIASNDEKTIEAIVNAAKEDALELLSISNLLDTDAIVVGGPIVSLGSTFTKPLCDYFVKYDANKGECSLRISALDEASIIGAFVKGREDFLANTFDSLAKKRNKD
jgi:predicted NBD/HSP70 family sugar kinase